MLHSYIVRDFWRIGSFLKCAKLNSYYVQRKSISSVDNQLTIKSDLDGIRTILLNNPRKRNALSLDMLCSLFENLSLSNTERDIRVVIIRSNGPVFSAGHDLKELINDRGTAYHRDVFDKCTEVMTLIQKLSIPVIAEVRGLATAAGCQLVASCDIVISSKTAKFATPGVSVGLFCSTPAVALARNIPRKVAMNMLFTGQPINAEDAFKCGLISKIVDDEELENEVNLVAKHICSFSKPVISLGKECFYKQIELGRDEAYEIAGNTMVDNLKQIDTQEGIAAFIGKRKPLWTDRNETVVINEKIISDS